MSEAAIGTQMAVRALLHILLSGAFLPLQRRLGTVRLYQLTMWTSPPTMLCLPLLNFIARQGHETTWPFNLGLSVFFLLWCFNGFAWSKPLHCPKSRWVITLNIMHSFHVYYGHECLSFVRCPCKNQCMWLPFLGVFDGQDLMSSML